jgi:serine/threonine protein kinase
VAHRDINPNNILVKYGDPDYNPEHLHIKLSDFGLSKTGSLKTFATEKHIFPLKYEKMERDISTQRP